MFLKHLLTLVKPNYVLIKKKILNFGFKNTLILSVTQNVCDLVVNKSNFQYSKLLKSGFKTS